MRLRGATSLCPSSPWQRCSPAASRPSRSRAPATAARSRAASRRSRSASGSPPTAARSRAWRSRSCRSTASAAPPPAAKISFQTAHDRPRRRVHGEGARRDRLRPAQGHGGRDARADRQLRLRPARERHDHDDLRGLGVQVQRPLELHDEILSSGADGRGSACRIRGSVHAPIPEASMCRPHVRLRGRVVLLLGLVEPADLRALSHRRPPAGSSARRRPARSSRSRRGSGCPRRRGRR